MMLPIDVFNKLYQYKFSLDKKMLSCYYNFNKAKF